MLLLPRWLWLNHIPDGLSLSLDDRRRLRKRMRAMGPETQAAYGVGRRMMWHMVGGISVAVVVFFVWIVLLLSLKLTPGRFALANTAGILGFNLLIWISLAYGINRGMRPLVWRGLNDIGFRVCMGCGYVLEHLPADEPRCPECGDALQPPMAPAVSIDQSSA